MALPQSPRACSGQRGWKAAGIMYATNDLWIPDYSKKGIEYALQRTQHPFFTSPHGPNDNTTNPDVPFQGRLRVTLISSSQYPLSMTLVPWIVSPGFIPACATAYLTR